MPLQTPLQLTCLSPVSLLAGPDQLATFQLCPWGRSSNQGLGSMVCTVPGAGHPPTWTTTQLDPQQCMSLAVQAGSIWGCSMNMDSQDASRSCILRVPTHPHPPRPAQQGTGATVCPLPAPMPG